MNVSTCLFFYLLFQVLFPAYRQPGHVRCPKCKRQTVTGNGVRQETRTVKDLDGEQQVFSWRMTCKDCPEHTAQGESVCFLVAELRPTWTQTCDL